MDPEYIYKKGVLKMVAVGGLRYTIAHQSVLLGVSACPPRKILDFGPSEIVSGAVSGQK